jgi:sugar lactone lactonase YvrE
MCYIRQLSRGVVGAAVALGAWGVLALVGCDSSDSTGPPPPPGSGRLAVTITAPAGVTPSVTVSGPAGYHQTLTVTQTLTGLAPGSYTVAAGPVLVPHPIVATVYDATITGGTASVTNGTTATATASYAVRPGTGALWVGSAVGGLGSYKSTLLAYSATQLAASTSAAPAIALAENAVPAAAAFDAGGTLWAAMNHDDQVVNVGTVIGFGAWQLQQATSLPYPVTPMVTLTVTSGSREFLQGIAVDAGGSVWVTNYTASAIAEFTPSQFSNPESPTPAAAVTLSATSGSLSGPAGLAFDANGNLWVANAISNTVVQFTASQLAASGSPTPAATLGATSGSLDRPFALAFDARGNLWVANANASTVVEFTATQLAASGSPTPAVTLSAANGSLSSPSGLAFDASGDLWVANDISGTVVEFGASQLAASGAPAPIVTLSGSALSGLHRLAFDPPAPSLSPWGY